MHCDGLEAESEIGHDDPLTASLRPAPSGGCSPPRTAEQADAGEGDIGGDHGEPQLSLEMNACAKLSIDAEVAPPALRGRSDEVEQRADAEQDVGEPEGARIRRPRHAPA